MRNSQKKQNEVWTGLNSGINLKEKIPQIVGEITKKCAFIPDRLLSTSSWWNQSTGVGAFHFSGKFDGKPAALKVQGVKPSTSEIYMINSFAKQNRSKIIRPPHVYASFPWDEEKKYEAFILEDVGKNLIVKVPTDKMEVDNFFELYREYRSNCLNNPWIEKPNLNLETVVKSRFNEWIEASHKVFPDHPFREKGDEDVVLKSVEILTKNRDWLKTEFVHGHLSARDLFKSDNEVVVLSNLYWSWRTPYYDLVFAYHWFMYDLANVKDITPEIVEAQRSLWLDKIQSIAKDKTLLKYSLLERSAAGLNLDALSVDTNKPIAKYLVGRTREITRKLIEELS
jgi:hypothetical protein